MALQDTLTAKNIRNAWKAAGLFNLQSTTQKLAPLPSTDSPLPFCEDNYILVESSRTSTRGERRKKKEELAGRKSRAETEVEKKPTSKPSIENQLKNDPPKITVSTLKAEDQKHPGQQTVTTRSGRKVTTFDWTSIASHHLSSHSTE